ncbi:cyclin-D5-1-like [Phragmites australis]|uniref:cyclin-D5-1-like n=1 Tax=Phragmites australis TaxID=29695 RepID=UPI002D772082|nr:cyclin-D5-1-like [Phragmites australis]
MGEAEEAYSSGCSFSLMCQEDSADLDAVFADNVADGKLVMLYSDAEEGEEEYMDHLVSKESNFCCSPSSSSTAFSDAGAESSPSSMASEEWFQCVRRATVKWIFETRAYFGFYHRTAYLAVAYFDRFCLHRCIDRSVMPWAARMLAVACVSLAAKMEEYRAPALSEFRADDEYDFSCVSIRRMELLVLSTLGWRMGDVTPLDYLPCLFSMLRRGNGRGSGLVAGKAAALIFSTAEVASVLYHRPSTVAAAAVLAATHGTLTKEALESKMSDFSPSFLVEKEDVYACYSLMLSDNSPPTNKTAKRPSSRNDSIGAASAYDSVDAVSLAEAASSNKRTRMELPGIRR